MNPNGVIARKRETGNGGVQICRRVQDRGREGAQTFSRRSQRRGTRPLMISVKNLCRKVRFWQVLRRKFSAIRF
jgi:hypothetical protein